MLQIQLLSLDAGADQIFRLSLSNEPTEDEASVVDSASPVSSADAPKIEVVQPSAATPERGNLQPTQRYVFYFYII
jgi:hypothetical protein